jgi:hypothetical protein
MNYLRSFGLLTTALVVFACGGGGQATTAPATSAAVTPAAATSAASAQPTTAPETSEPATEAPTDAASTASTLAPGSSLDPSVSDAGVVGRVTISNDSRGERDGTHDIIGLADDGSDCSYSFEGDTFTAVAWYDDAPNGLIHQMAVSVNADDMPAADGDTTSGITDGSAYIDFVSESGFGTAYYGAASRENGGSSTIDATWRGETLVFSYVGKTWDDVDFSGQMICAGFAG